MYFYRQLGDLIGTTAARDLSAQLAVWHDAMVRHVRVAGSRKTERCGDGCPHDEAATLWSAARTIFGERATTLAFLRKHGTAGPRPLGFDRGAQETHV